MDDSPTALERALLDAAHGAGEPIPLPRGDVDMTDAYAVQRAVHANSRLPIMVWKLGLTGRGGREAMGVSEPIVGRLPASAIYCDRSEILFSGEEMFAEAELVFELADDLPDQARPYTRADVQRVLKGLYAGIEIVRPRFDSSDLPLGLLIADNVMAHGLVLGRRLATGWDDRFADLPVSLIRNGDAPVTGSTAQVMDNPLDAVVWLANWLREHEGQSLRREQLVASGTCTGATEILPGDRVRVNFEDAEGARITLIARDRKE